MPIPSGTRTSVRFVAVGTTESAVALRGSNHKGAVAELAIAAAAAKLGVGVLKPFDDHARYDLVFDLDGRFLRVQCKWARKEEEVVLVRLTGSRITTRGSVRTTYASHEIDAVAAYCAELDQCYLVPVELVAGMHGINLRLSPPRNAQRAWLHWASDFHLDGAIAQLGERLSGTQEVGGSSPPSSTLTSVASDTIEALGAHEFREHLGWYLQRVGRGEEFTITRRGKPFARLEPVRDGPGSQAPTARFGASPQSCSSR